MRWLPMFYEDLVKIKFAERGLIALSNPSVFSIINQWELLCVADERWYLLFIPLYGNGW